MPYMENPAAVKRQGSKNVASQADSLDPTPNLPHPQDLAVIWLARRAPVSLAMAATLVGIHNIGVRS